MRNGALTDRDKAIDWELIHRRLDASRAALEEAFAPGPEEQRRILRTRAKQLAREPKSNGRPEESLEIAEFLLAGERYGIESAYILEICALKELCPVPGTPPFVLGLINVRGRILSVIDIGTFFDLPKRGLTDLNKVIILRAGSTELGIVADAILTVRRIALTDLQAGLPTLTGIRADYTKGVTSEPLVVLDVEKLLSDERIIVDEG